MIFYILLGVATIITLAVWVKLRSVFTLFRSKEPATLSAGLDALPTVSLCIPARDEMHAMSDCLENALLSNYPKLEIIVLDDGSRDDTGHLIKSFAHSGVRFVEGSALPDGWLGKNHALAGLLHEASGDLILYADVDTRFDKDSISRMVVYMTAEKADMISVLPYRKDVRRASAKYATFRHFWSLIGHTTKRPAVSSSAWMVKREVLLGEFEGLKAISRAVRPDRAVAQQLSARSAYRYVISRHYMGVSYDKTLPAQYETSIRIYYPDFGLIGVLLRVAALALMLLPYVMVVYGLFTGDLRLALAAFVVTVIMSVVNAWYLGVLKSYAYGPSSLLLPFLMAREVYLLLASVIMYKRGRVTWKGRPVSLH